MPFNVFARAISAARVNLNVTRRAHATVDGSSTCRPFELASAGAAIVSNPHAGLERWFEPGSELLVVEDADAALEAYRTLLDDPAEAEAMGARARERVLDEHTYAHRARQVLRLARSRGGGARMSGPRIVAVVPAFQEEAAIGGVVEEIRRFDPAIDVVVVDDGSGDATAAAAAAPGATVVRLPFNLGIGGAVQTGFRWALERDYDVAVRLDGDGQHDPAELPKLLAPLERGEADVVTGSRFRGRATTRTGRRSRGASGITWFARLVSLLSGQRVTDTTSGFQALNREGIALFARRLPERLPRGRGDGARAQAPAPARRGARADARARARLLLDHVPALGVLRDQGDARAVRRDGQAVRRPSEGAQP